MGFVLFFIKYACSNVVRRELIQSRVACVRILFFHKIHVVVGSFCEKNVIWHLFLILIWISYLWRLFEWWYCYMKILPLTKSSISRTTSTWNSCRTGLLPWEYLREQLPLGAPLGRLPEKLPVWPFYSSRYTFEISLKAFLVKLIFWKLL